MNLWLYEALVPRGGALGGDLVCRADTVGRQDSEQTDMLEGISPDSIADAEQTTLKILEGLQSLLTFWLSSVVRHWP